MGIFTPHPHPEGPTAVYLRALCFVFHGDALLLIHRQQEPDAGFWNAPGGKVDRGEDPLDAARRELREEAGIEPLLGFRGVATAIVRSTGEHWAIFLFYARVEESTVVACHEGPLRWVPPDGLAALPVFPDIPLLLPHIRDPHHPVVLARFIYSTPDPGTLESADIR